MLHQGTHILILYSFFFFEIVSNLSTVSVNIECTLKDNIHKQLKGICGVFFMLRNM